VIVLDYGGQVADYDRILPLAHAHGIAVLENASPALGGSYQGKMAGAFGDVAVTDFHTAKLITTIDGGMVFTDDPELARRARMVRGQGEDPQRKYLHALVGANHKLNDVQAAIGLVQLERLPELLAGRTRVAERYDALLADLADRVQLPRLGPERVHGWFSYAILVEDRDAVQARLKEQGVDARAAWPVPIYRQPAYSGHFPPDTRYPVAEHVAARILNLPLYPTMTEQQQDFVVECLRRALEA
jgi:dTDP-4-amino-4,6-dideoxygalactose transaminase